MVTASGAFESKLVTAIGNYMVANQSAFHGQTIRFSDVYSSGYDGFTVYLENFEQTQGKQIQIRDYAVDNNIDASGHDTIGIQFTIKGDSDPNSVKDIVDGLFTLFHGLWSVTLGNVKVVQVERRSGVALGLDGSGRVSRTENYYFTVHRPTPNRT